MGCAHDIDRQLDRFLKEHCPDPALIRSAITRAQLWAVAEYLPDEMICRRGDRVRACWLVLSGQIEIRADDQTVAFRGAGELVGEPGLLHFLAGKTGARTADIKACGPVRLLNMPQGRRENAWSGNVVAIGNASSFVEPLAAAGPAILAFQCQWLARSLIELHGGSLRIDSDKGRGTTVAVLLSAARIREPRSVKPRLTADAAAA